MAQPRTRVTRSCSKRTQKICQSAQNYAMDAAKDVSRWVESASADCVELMEISVDGFENSLRSLKEHVEVSSLFIFSL